jgi:hypothetical protein
LVIPSKWRIWDSEDNERLTRVFDIVVEFADRVQEHATRRGSGVAAAHVGTQIGGAREDELVKC